MKPVLLLPMAILMFGSVACTTSSDEPSVSEDELTSIATGTYVIDARPFGTYYAERITVAEGKNYEAEIVTISGETQLIAGTFVILPARANDPDSPVKSDKPTLILGDDSGNAGVSFELDELPGGGLRLYHSARQISFTMKRDPSYRPAATKTKRIACTGDTVDAKLTLDQAQNRRGTLQLTRKPAADRHDPPNVTVIVTKNEDGAVAEYVYFEGSSGEQDYYVNMKRADFERGSGDVELNLRWAEGGEELGVGVTCKYE